MRHAAENCKKCILHKERTKVVWSRGNPFAPIVLIGDAPSREDDIAGVPLIDKAGKKLDEVLVKAKDFADDVPIAPDEVLIVTMLKCKTPLGRGSLPTEQKECSKYLIKQLELARPYIIITLGEKPSHTLIGACETLDEYRAKTHQIEIGNLVVPTIATLAPTELLVNGGGKVFVEDIKKVIELFRELMK